MDSLWEHLFEIKIEEDVILKLVNSSKTQDYETESMYVELEMNYGNITQQMINHEDCFGAVINLFANSQAILRHTLMYLFFLARA